MKKLLLTLIYFMLTCCASTTNFHAKKNKDGDLIGIVTKNHFKQEPYSSEWYNDFYSYYEVDKSILNSLEDALKEINIIGFMGTWCSDSQREIPNFYKLLDGANYDYKKLKLIAVDKNKKAKGLEKNYNIIRVPTFIFYKNGKEIGRFVEHPIDESTIEKDILTIISGTPYKHPYQK
ncbi:MAG TPA: thiol reductase thioredoxin [Tenacibaculum sp.]|nr:thiol reductase thioredoxin [Tenacibaculum sp.]